MKFRYFPLSPYYWCGNSKNQQKSCFFGKKNNKKSNKFYLIVEKIFGGRFNSKKRIIEQEEQRQSSQKNKLNNSIEQQQQQADAAIGIQIEKLHKVYSRGNNHALKGLSVNFYENEITAFLGHNGAGKSTTMHLLTGLYRPTSGTAKINGLDIRNSMNKIRKSLGFVPQHNVLFPGLTVKEHLWFFARLKGLDRDSTLIEIERMLDDTGLDPKKDDISKDLSGGMQRKLSGYFLNNHLNYYI
jgi:ATP-binding cassette subfamily A (ABC1) protein 1